MNIETAVERVLARLSDEQVTALAAAVQPLTEPRGELVVLVAGAGPAAARDVASLSDAWSRTPSLGGVGLALALRIGLAARRDAEQRRAAAVWTGPGAEGERRLTASVLHELIASANEQVLLVSFAAYTLSELAQDLRAAIDRGCAVDVVFETEEDSAGKYDGPGNAAFSGVSGLTRWRWPSDRREPGASLHAKVLVIDRRQALVGSANLTAAALTKNLEAGVLIRDDDVAAGLDDHVRRLMSEGVLSVVVS